MQKIYSCQILRIGKCYEEGALVAASTCAAVEENELVTAFPRAEMAVNMAMTIKARIRPNSTEDVPVESVVNRLKKFISAP